MEYIDIIRNNCQCHSPVKWWPRFAFHYTDVTNAVSILNSGCLYSRTNASRLKVMKNDNASNQVIDMTKIETVSNVRFYFRPLTPTQYYNEGYKHPALRYDNDNNANVPVPIFLLFDLKQLLALPATRFSETSLAGYGAQVFGGVEAFSKLYFDYIYDNEYENIGKTKGYRQAEIIYPGFISIEPYITNILCRNSLEQVTLLNLLRDNNPSVYSKYKSIIKVCKKEAFENNGLFLSSCIYCNNSVIVSFSDTYASKTYIKRMLSKNNVVDLLPILVTVVLKWFAFGEICTQKIVEFDIDIRNSGKLVISGLPEVPRAQEIGIEVFFEDKLMCYVKQPLESVELWK